MRYIITEEQYNQYRNITYAPEKINGFVADAQKCADYLKKIYEQYYSHMLALSVGDVMENPEPLRQTLEKLEKEKKYVDNLTNKYYNAIEMYPVGEYPDNVTKLDKLYDEIDNVQTDIDNIKDIFQAVYDSVTHFRQWNQEKLK